MEIYSLQMLPAQQISTASSLPSILDPETNELVMRNRIKNPASLASLYQSLFIADFQASRARALVQSEVDGNPPFSDCEDRKNGVLGRTNVNWGYATQSQQDIEEPYNSLFESIDTFGTTPTRYGSELERNEWSQIISEEITRMVRNWPDFSFNTQMSIHLFTMFGLSFTFREDRFDWRWKVYDLQYLKLPRRTRATINDVDLVTCKVSMLPAKLQEKIENEEVAKKAGWNVEAVKAAMKTASQKAPDSSNPQELEQSYKDQDYFTGISATTVDLVHGWVAEVDGTITHIIGRYDGVGEFLYKCEGLYTDMSQLITAYTYGVGSNGDFYSLRGNAWRGHNASVTLNLLTSKFLDQAIVASTPHIQASSEDAIIDQMIRPRGPYNVVDQGVTLMEVPHIPFDKSLIPAIQAVQGIFQMRTRSPSNAFNAAQGGSKTAEEIKTQNEIDGRLTTSGMDLFFTSWKNDWKETVRRSCTEDLVRAHPGGEEAFKMRKRCLERGVPIEAIYAVDVDAIEINRGIGRGSAQERRGAFNALMPVIGRYDAEGQQVLLRQFTASYTDSAFAHLMVPMKAGERPPIDLQVANMENQIMMLGGTAQLEPNQDDVVHVGSHLQQLSQLNEALSQMQIELEPAINQMQPIFEHAEQHMERIDPANSLFPDFKEALQQIGEVVINGRKHIDAEKRKAEEEAGKAQAEGGLPQGTENAAIDAQARLAMLDVTARQQDLAFDAEKHRQDLAFKDAEFAQSLQQEAIKQSMQKPKEG